MHVVNMTCQNNAHVEALAGKNKSMNRRFVVCVGNWNIIRSNKVHNMNIEILCMLVIVQMQ